MEWRSKACVEFRWQNCKKDLHQAKTGSQKEF